MTEPAFSPAAERNKLPILEVLRQVLPTQGTALEIASGTGQHVAWFAQHLPAWTWQPTDAQVAALDSVMARIAQGQLGNVHAPLLVDVMSPAWLPAETQPFDAIYCANMLHIAPWATCAALMHGSARHLSPEGVLVTYGPYLEDTVETSRGNQDFDRDLRLQDPDWGLRRLEDVQAVATQAGLRLQQRFALPANNLLLVWTRTP
ncbi:SAM-dependent methyltransferase [Rhodoferax lacus]|uniref:SAM-dependent methyltransferase n=1 Tax=Rhodoferax lacus TaxID=2184758 RepID=A0A3E1RH25_9BURK|nr:SAM-dependent methyltransferase [Rhodoferax lacus]